MDKYLQSGALTLIQTDITTLDVDVIVNAANGTLLGGGGVDGAIHRAAGPQLLHACRQVREQQLAGDLLPTGHAVMTPGYDLPARFVIHTVGPIWHANDEEHMHDALANCYRNAFALAEHNGLRSIAFPSISTGAYGFPIDAAARVALTEIRRALRCRQVDRVIMALFSEHDLAVYQATLTALGAGQ